MSGELPLLDFRPPKILGSTFDESRDGPRLNAQALRVMNLMRDGKFRGLAEISFVTGDPEASISARLRDFRRAGFTVERRYIRKGLHHYRVVA